MTERYQFDKDGLALLEAAKSLLQKTVASGTLRAAQVVSVAKMQHVLSRFPKVTTGLTVSVSVSSPRFNFGEIETWHWWTVEVEEERLSISSHGHFFRPSTGGDTFLTMSWEAFPGSPADLNDYQATLSMVPDVQSFPAAVASIDFTSRAYRVEIHDADNSLLEGDDDDEDGESEEDGTEDDTDEQDHDPWVVTPCNDAERTLAATIISSEVEANEPVYTDNPGTCGFCGCELDQRGLFVDGCLRGEVAWGNMCAGCFATKGAGIGWGKGQLYARQPDGSWRMVAGFA